MLKFIKRILFSLFVLVISDNIIDSYIEYLPNKEVDKRLEFVLNGKINKEIIIVGSSRGARNIIASDLEEITGKTTYNLSYPGSDVTFHEFVIRTLLKFNNPPQYIVLTMDGRSQLTPNSSINFRFDRLYPLVKYNYILEELIQRQEISPGARYINILRIKPSQYDFRPREFGKLDSLLECGSMPISFQDERLDTIFYDNKETLYSEYLEKESKKKTEALLSIREICKNYGVELVIVFPPNLYRDPKGLEERILRLLNMENAIMIPSDNHLFKNPYYYYDNSHLQKNGAKYFSIYLAEVLERDFQKNKPVNIFTD